MTNTFKVTANTNTITFNSIPDTALSAGPVTLTATATSGQPVSFASNSGTVCSVSGSSVTLLMVGTCSITATQGGGGNFAAATPVTNTFNVTKGVVVITWATPADILFGGTLGSAQLNATASVAGTFVYSPVAGTVLPVGDGQTLSVTFTPTDTVNYNGATKQVLINVKPTVAGGSPANVVPTYKLSRDVSGSIFVTVTLANAGGTTAPNVTIAGATLGGVPSPSVPVVIGPLAPGAQASTVLVFPNVGNAGTRSVLSLSGTFDPSGSFGGNTRVTLP